jgi:hypothetical protein
MPYTKNVSVFWGKPERGGKYVIIYMMLPGKIPSRHTQNLSHFYALLVFVEQIPALVLERFPRVLRPPEELG